jgi:crotonobetaine/carnitine-CoA ligase
MTRMDASAWPFSGQDIRTLLNWQRSQRRDQTFLIWEPFEGEGRTWSYGEFVAWVERFAAGLSARGVKPGERVLVHLENCPEAIVAWLGCAAAGAVAVTTNARSSPDELAFFAGDSAAVAALTQPKFVEIVARACPGARWIAVTDTDSGEAPSRPPTPNDRFDAITADAAELPVRAPGPAAPFGVQYTSGTTSRPKGVVWSHANALWGARISAAHEDLRCDDVHLVTMPLYHTNAQAYSVLASLWAGATVVLQPRFSASRFWSTALKHRCTWTSMVPFCLKALAQLPLPEHHNFRLWGNAYCSPPEDTAFGVKTVGWWGMTETITHGIVGLPQHPNTPMTMGRAAPEYEIRVLNDRRRPAEPGETGDLSIRGVRGLSIFSEYLNNPDASARAFDAEGFLLTGDRVGVSPDGSLHFADRAKDMLKVGGENVSAAEIERVILAVPGVREVAVVGKPHPMLDEVPVAFVLADSREHPSVADLAMAACHRTLASFKHPHEVRIVSELPRATLEKVAKAQLRAMLRAEDCEN